MGVARTRQLYVFSALILEAMALLIRGVWFLFKTSDNKPESPHGVIMLGFVSRTSEVLQYCSVIVVCWQWSLLCGRILNWDSAKFRRYGVALVR